MREITMDLRVRYDEVDRMGYVHHSHYLKYFEIGRTELLRACGGSYRRMEERDELVVVVRVDCRYRKPAEYDDVIQVRTRIKSISDAKVVHEYEIRRERETLVDATVVLAVIDREGNLQRVPQELIDLYGDE